MNISPLCLSEGAAAFCLHSSVPLQSLLVSICELLLDMFKDTGYVKVECLLLIYDAVLDLLRQVLETLGPSALLFL